METATVETSVPAANGAVADTKPGPSLLTKIKMDWVAGGSKEPTAAQRDPAWKAWRASNKAIEDARAALEAALEKNYVVSDALARMYGGRSVRVDGKVYDFASRGEKVFLRTKGVKQTIVDV